MPFAVVLPWWGYALAYAGAAVLAWLAYARLPLALSPVARAGLVVLRAATLAALVTILLRPVIRVPAGQGASGIVPVLVDVSRSMRLADGGGASRLERAEAIVRGLEAGLGSTHRVELLTCGEALAPGARGSLAATGRRSDLGAALADVGDRYPRDRVAGVVMLSDGGDTAPEEGDAPERAGAPVFAVGIGSAALRDREVITLTAGEAVLPGASIDLSVSAAAAGFGRGPIELRVSANGRPVAVRRVAPPADGAPVHEVFTVSPAPGAATVYTVEIPATPDEAAPENNRRSVLVPPPAARRRVLIVEGAPGFEHTFLKRALAGDPGLEVDAVVRKGRDAEGHDTFYVQAAPARATALASGYPTGAADLFAYDAIVLGNIERDVFTREQLELTRDFVARRGGGLVVMGARSFDRGGFSGTPVDEVLPVDATDRRAALARAAGASLPTPPRAAVLTPDGATHPATRLATAADDNRRRWAELPPLSSIAAVGGPRPGAQVLVAGAAADGELGPVIAAQRYGPGRSLVFAGEASWRWRMERPAADTSYDTIWRQVARWAAAGSETPVAIAPLAPPTGASERVTVAVRDEAFEPVGNAEVEVTLTGPDGRARSIGRAVLDRAGRYQATARFDQPGVYRVDARASRGGAPLGRATRLVLVGGADVEMSQPQLNDAVLRRAAEATGGRYVAEAEAGTLVDLVRRTTAPRVDVDTLDVWHNGWSLLAIVGLLAAEWMMRRRTGLR